jgi:hypothetical protein
MTQEMVQDLVVAVHKEQGERFKAYEAANESRLLQRSIEEDG